MYVLPACIHFFGKIGKFGVCILSSCEFLLVMGLIFCLLGMKKIRKAQLQQKGPFSEMANSRTPGGCTPL